MRYDKFLQRLEKARDKYEQEVRQLIQTALKEDSELGNQILKGLKPHWTQTARGRKIMAMRKKK